MKKNFASLEKGCTFAPALKEKAIGFLRVIETVR